MKPRKNKSNEVFLPLRPHTLISLWDMIHFFEDEAQRSVSSLEMGLREVKSIKIKNAGEILSRKQNKWIEQMVSKSYFISNRLNLADSLKRSAAIMTKLRHVGRNASEVYADLDGLFNSFMSDMCSIQCAYIPKDKIDWFDKGRLFGDSVYMVFPDARHEIESAGNCLALDLNTAAVFHLMRVAEVGLRKLAKTYGVKLPHQIEFATWGKVLEAIQVEIDKKGVRRSKAKEKKLQRYSYLLLDIKAFQHLWRNPVSHLRGRYDDLQARSAYNHVRDFMQKLAEDN